MNGAYKYVTHEKTHKSITKKKTYNVAIIDNQALLQTKWNASENALKILQIAWRSV